MKKFIIYFEADEEIYIVKFILANDKDHASSIAIELGLTDEKYKIQECK
jgi:hypothetical protein